MVLKDETIPIKNVSENTSLEQLHPSKNKEGDIMKIGFIGAGRVGCTLGKYLSSHGKCITGYYSRNPENAKAAAEFTDTKCFSSMTELFNSSDAIFLTVSDNAIPLVYNELLDQLKDDKSSLKGKILCHTSGACSSSVFTESDKYGFYAYSIHPIFAVSDKYTSYINFDKAFITIEGSPEYQQDLKELFNSCELKTAVISAENKSKYHAASVMASNFVCGLFNNAVKLLVECGFDKDEAATALSGLFIKNAEGIALNGPIKQLTGPIERNDSSTIKKHLSVLSESDRELYLILSKVTLKLAEEKNKERDYSDMENLLGGND